MAVQQGNRPAHATRAPSNVPLAAAQQANGGGANTSTSSSNQPVAPTASSSGSGGGQDALSVILVTAGYDHTIRFWEAWSGICSRTIQHPDSQVNKLKISPDKRFLAVAANSHVRLYDCNLPSNNPPAGTGPNTTNPNAHQGGNPIATFEGHNGNVTSVDWHCEGKWLVTGSEDGTLKIWDTR